MDLPRAALLDCAERIERDLRQNVLPFWVRHAAPAGDGKAPRIIGQLSDDLVADPEAERGMLLAGRILWAFSAAFARYPERDYANLASAAYLDLQTFFWDRKHGGYFWSLNPDGSPRKDRKQIFGEAFAIYALSEYHIASACSEPLHRAIEVFELIERHARDRQCGGYLEAFTADWVALDDVRLSAKDQNEPKSQNTVLHLIEGYTRLLTCWPEPRLGAALRDLVELMLDKVVQPNGHIGHFFSRDWQLRSDVISYGHDIEAAWLLNEAADVLGDPALSARVQKAATRLAELTLAKGTDKDGGIFGGGGPGGVTNTTKGWWQQTEAVVGFLDAYRRTGDSTFLAAAVNTWDFTERFLIDRKHGEWISAVACDGAPVSSEPKISFWKCPYHNVRAGLRAVPQLREAAGRKD